MPRQSKVTEAMNKGIQEEEEVEIEEEEKLPLPKKEFNFNKYKVNLYENIINKIMEIYKSEINIDTINKIKEFSNILSNSINLTEFIKQFLSTLIENNTITNQRKYKLIPFLTDIQYNYTKSYHKTIYFEYIILNVYNICYL